MSSSDKERRRAELELKIQAHRRKKDYFIYVWVSLRPFFSWFCAYSSASGFPRL